ncbi:MAG: DUF262 domain-containing protein [Marinilabiliaceae bacterium]
MSELNLDFIYGADEKGKIFTPLDGQQRLTTLWLLHWLAAARERIGEEANILKNFTYETRVATRRFCEFLTGGTFAPTFGKEKISDEIKDRPEFIIGWEDDPSVAGMLTMLDALNDAFYGKEPMDGLWGKLDHITFFRESIEDLGVTDDIYIKMNSRGKPLTKFENLKVELDKLANDFLANDEFSKKLDTDWTDIFWKLRTERGEDHPTVDEALLNYIRFVADIITYKSEGNRAPKDDFEMLKRVYSDKENIALLSEAFDVWKECDSENFFNKFFTGNEKPDDPLRVNIQDDVNLLRALSEKKPQNRLAILMWGVVTYLRNKDNISEHDFSRRIRTLRNLLWHSADELREERMKQIIGETERLICDGVIDEASASFNKDQKKEEAKKLKWLEGEGRDNESKLAELENMGIVTGSTQSISIEAFDLYDTFISVFRGRTDFVELTRAVLSCGNPKRKDGPDWRYLIPGKSQEMWKKVFEPGGWEEFRENFPVALHKMLEAVKSGRSLDDIISCYLADPQTQKDWRYYMVKYPVIIGKSEFGKYIFPIGEAGLDFFVMKTRTNRSGRHYGGILLAIKRLASGGNVDFEKDYAGDLIIKSPCGGQAEIKLSNRRDHFELRRVGLDGETTSTENIPIDMASGEVDAEDRVEKIVKMLRPSDAI